MFNCCKYRLGAIDTYVVRNNNRFLVVSLTNRHSSLSRLERSRIPSPPTTDVCVISITNDTSFAYFRLKYWGVLLCYCYCVNNVLIKRIKIRKVNIT